MRKSRDGLAHRRELLSAAVLLIFLLGICDIGEQYHLVTVMVRHFIRQRDQAAAGEVELFTIGRDVFCFLLDDPEKVLVQQRRTQQLNGLGISKNNGVIRV